MSFRLNEHQYNIIQAEVSMNAIWKSERTRGREKARKRDRKLSLTICMFDFKTTLITLLSRNIYSLEVRFVCLQLNVKIKSGINQFH